MYFRNFPDIYYIYDINNQPQLKAVKDVTTNVRFRKQILENITIFDEYDVKEGETPEIVAHNVYGSSQYHWIIMLCNDIHDVREQWPLTGTQLLTSVSDKYNKFNVTSWTYDDGVVTFTTPKHTLSVGVEITSSGMTATTNPPNGIFTISAITKNTVSIPYTKVPTGTFGVNYGFLKSSNREYLIKHYVKDRIVVDQGTPFATPVTFFQYEQDINEQKRRIKLINRQLLPTVLAQFNDLV